MAYIVSTAQHSLNAASTNLTLELPYHQTDDVIVFFASMDSGTATATPGSRPCFFRTLP